MHDIDTRWNEFGQGEMENGEMGFEFGNMEFGEMSSYGETDGEYEGASDLNEMVEMELAAELLSITNDREMEQFLGSLIKKAGTFVKSPVGKALGGVLKGIAKKALPVVGGEIGSFVAPGVGTAIGSCLAPPPARCSGWNCRRRSLRLMIFAFVRLLDTAEGKAAALPLAQRRFSILRLRFIAILAQLDIFAIVLNQRSEHDTGIWLSGSDAFAADALALPGRVLRSPAADLFPGTERRGGNPAHPASH